MKKKEFIRADFPTSDQLEKELDREINKKGFWPTLGSVLYYLLTITAILAIAVFLFFPIMRVDGSSMKPTLHDRDMILSVKGSHFDNGDVIAFYYNNKVLVKRVIAKEGQLVDIKKDGTVYVDGNKLDEPYVEVLSYETCDIELPYRVPDSSVFVLGDRRHVSLDSRSSFIGCIKEEQIIGKVMLKIWPWYRIGTVE